MEPADHQILSRRAVLLGGAASVALAACGSSSKGAGAHAPTSASRASLSLVAFFSEDAVLAHHRQRLTFGIGDDTGALISDGPAVLDLDVVRGGRVLQRIRAHRHASGLPRGYYPIEADLGPAGTYEVHATVQGQRLEAAFAAAEKVALPRPGTPMPRLHTPTVADTRGVDPICTRRPRCPFHTVDLSDALAAERPVALLISTPAYCQVGICGPVLDLLIAARPHVPAGVQMIHAEVYANGKQAQAHLAQGTAVLAPVLRELGLTFEPCLFVIGADGLVRVRLDTIFDAVELRQALDEAV